jgi:hypothetical protein
LDKKFQFTCWAYGDKDTLSRSDTRMMPLLLVVENCDYLDLRFTTCNPRKWESVVQLFLTQPWLVPVMEKCWAKCSFRTICRLGEYSYVCGDWSLYLNRPPICRLFPTSRNFTAHRYRIVTVQEGRRYHPLGPRAWCVLILHALNISMV